MGICGKLSEKLSAGICRKWPKETGNEFGKARPEQWKHCKSKRNLRSQVLESMGWKNNMWGCMLLSKKYSEKP